MTTFLQYDSFFQMAQEGLTLLDAINTNLTAVTEAIDDISENLATYAAHGEGSITTGATHADITHGLGITPTRISITPEDGFDAPYEIARASTSTTIFRVQYKGSVTQPTGTTGYFLWEAGV